MIGFVFLGEAIALGLVSGPACIASCGPVIVPTLLAERAGLRLNTRFLLFFLGTRFLGYMLFAGIAWQLGTLASTSQTHRALIFGTIHVLIAMALIWYARSVGRPCTRECGTPELVSIGARGKRGLPGAALLGFLTGISLCPPFLAAGVRASELQNVASALLYFTAFFVGTSIWFVPFLVFGRIRRNEGVITVARMAMVLIAIYYGFLGVTMLVGRTPNGY